MKKLTYPCYYQSGNIHFIKFISNSEHVLVNTGKNSLSIESRSNPLGMDSYWLDTLFDSDFDMNPISKKVFTERVRQVTRQLINKIKS